MYENSCLASSLVFKIRAAAHTLIRRRLKIRMIAGLKSLIALLLEISAQRLQVFKLCQ